MIRVNLLPFRAARKKENVKRQVVIFVALIAVFFLACIVYSGYQLGKISGLEKEMAEAETQLIQYQKQAAEVDKIKAEIKALETREATINGLKGSRFEAVKILDFLTGLVVEELPVPGARPEQRLWLQTMGTDTGDEFLTLSLKGVAVENKDVAAFLDRLEKHSETVVDPVMGVRDGSKSASDDEESAPDLFFQDVFLLRLSASKDPYLLNFKEFAIECKRLLPQVLIDE